MTIVTPPQQDLRVQNVMPATTSVQPDARPLAWLVAPTFGLHSEVWMYRQATQCQKLAVRVIANRYENQREYPLPADRMRTAPRRTRQLRGKLLNRAYVSWLALRNRGNAGFRGSAVETAWWLNELEAQRPSVALCHYGTTAVRMAGLVTKSGVPVVAHFNGFDLSSALEGIGYRRTLKRILPKLSACVVVADYMREWLLENGAKEDAVRKIPYGVPIADLPVAANLQDEPCRFLAVGRLTPKKRPDLTLRAFASCVERGAEATLTLIGDGPLEDPCKQLARSLGVSSRVEFCGARPFAEVREALGRSSAFVQHSVTAENGDKEGWPVAVAEAAGSGLPVVSTRHASIPEQVEHGVTGLLCDEGDWRTMADHMLSLASSPDQRVAMGAAARRKLAEFDVRNQVAKLEDFLIEVVQKNR